MFVQVIERRVSDHDGRHPHALAQRFTEATECVSLSVTTIAHADTAAARL